MVRSGAEVKGYLMKASSEERARRLVNWMGQVASGDQRAFARLYAETSPQLFAVILRILRQESLAEEVLQEVYIRVWKKASSYDAGKARVTTWLATIARNRALDELRGRKDGLAVDLDLEHLPDDSNGDPQRLTGVALDARDVNLCLDELEPDQKRSIALAYYEGLTHSELAMKLDSPLGTVKSWIRRGLLRLKACLERERGDAAV